MAKSKTKTASIQQQLGKHFQLSKAQKGILVAAAIGIFVVVFTIVAAKSLITQRNYQSEVIGAKQDALDQLKTNEETVVKLSKSYQTFVSTPNNALDGNPEGDGPQDGSNAVLVLDALPDHYDFPSLTSSLEMIILGQNMRIDGISGQDDQINQQKNISSSKPEPVAMPFSVSASGPIKKVQDLVDQFEHSIRPFQIKSLNLKGEQDDMSISITAQTYYQPSKNFNVKKKAVE